jgi:hypothetical protein
LGNVAFEALSWYNETTTGCIDFLPELAKPRIVYTLVHVVPVHS